MTGVQTCALPIFWWRRVPAWAYAIGYGAAFALAFSLSPTAYVPFIYFQF